jgi:hypothetical protein
VGRDGEKESLGDSSVYSSPFKSTHILDCHGGEKVPRDDGKRENHKLEISDKKPGSLNP